jgi:cell division septal protein FtsQ
MALELNQRQEWIRTRRQKRKGAKIARLRRQFLRYVVLVAICSAALYTLGHMRWTLSNLESDVTIRGNQVASDEQIRSSISDYLEKPIYAMDPRKMAGRICQLPVIKYAFVRRYALPHPRLVVEVLEEFPWATFYTNPDEDPSQVIAQSGKMIPVKDFPHIERPELKIYGPNNMKLTARDINQWASWVAFIQDQTKQPVQSVDLRQPFDVRVQDGDLTLKLGTPDAGLMRRLARLASIMTAVEPLRDKLDYVDLGLDNNIPLRMAKKGDSTKHLVN